MVKDILELSDSLLNSLKVEGDFYYRDIAKYKDGNVVLIGMRRLGKTTYLKYRAKESGLKNDQILYLNFDSPIFVSINFEEKGERFFELIKEINSLLLLKNIKLVLYDEIQRISGWSKILKGFVDSFPEIQFVSTGSDALSLYSSSEMGVGRFQIIHIGPILYREAIKMHKGLSFVEYINNYSFPQGPKISDYDKYQMIVEKQINLSNFSKINVSSTLRAIALNPGNKLTKNAIAKKVCDESDSKVDSKQVEAIIDFLVKSNLVISISDIQSYQKFTKPNKFTLYPYDWNMYKYYSLVKNYNELESTIGNSSIKKLPTKGFVFENVVITNVYSSLRTDLDKNRIFNKVEEPDIDFILDGINYEIKSFNVFDADIDEQMKIINKAKITNAKIIHAGAAKNIDNIEFINVEAFLLDIK